MSAPNAVRGQYSHLFGSSMLPVLEEMFWSEYNLHPSRREQLFKIVQTDRDIWQSSEMHDMDLFAQVAEGAEYNYTRPKQGVTRTASVLKYGLGMSISKEAIEDGKFDLVADAVRKMGRSARESKEISAMSVFNNGFGSGFLSADGQYVFDTDHTLPSGLTYRNVLSTASDLSGTALDTMLYDFETQFVGDSGIIENIRPKYLVVNPANKRYALELIGSDLKADTADNNLNSLKSEGLQVVSSPHLTDTDAWFLVGDKQDHGLRIIERQALKTDSKENFDTDSMKYKSSYREVVTVTVAKGVFGSAGA